MSNANDTQIVLIYVVKICVLTDNAKIFMALSKNYVLEQYFRKFLKLGKFRKIKFINEKYSAWNMKTWQRLMKMEEKVWPVGTWIAVPSENNYTLARAVSIY